MNLTKLRSQASRLKNYAAGVAGAVLRRRRLTVVAVAGVLILTPLLTGDGEVFLLNMVGLGLAALILRRITMMTTRRRHRESRR